MAARCWRISLTNRCGSLETSPLLISALVVVRPLIHWKNDSMYACNSAEKTSRNAASNECVSHAVSGSEWVPAAGEDRESRPNLVGFSRISRNCESCWPAVDQESNISIKWKFRMLRHEKILRNQASCWCASPASPGLRNEKCENKRGSRAKLGGVPTCSLLHAIHQPTPMRRMQMTPFWTMIGPIIEAILNSEMTACNDVAIRHAPITCKSTCLLALLIWTEFTSWPYDWSTSCWALTCWAWAFFFLYCSRVFTFRLCFRCVPGTATKMGIWYEGGVLRIFENRLLSELTCLGEKLGSGRTAEAANGLISPPASPELHGLLVCMLNRLA